MEVIKIAATKSPDETVYTLVITHDEGITEDELPDVLEEFAYRMRSKEVVFEDMGLEMDEGYS